MLEILATVILIGLMLVPLVNVLVGVVAGFMLFGFFGAIAGFVIGAGLTGMMTDGFH
ncbi:hypothetical protein [Hyphomicrobium sp.]|uniref:hypothetical protein n=1 Tax=Hyphomicrobium sp. TaxID=82 RepID=UPI0025BA2868|nr:hypothetical protein [Hyphomicrobium sp.]MCC7251613.1 hypothetical protein [Hyphomicrobium sp.]